MLNSFKNKIFQKIISFLLIIAILTPSGMVLFYKPKKAEAVALFNVELGSAYDVLKTIAEQIFIAVVRRVLDKFTESTVNWINSGFEGKPLYVTNPESFFGDIAKNEAQAFIDLFGYDINAYPFGRETAINILGSYKKQFAKNAEYSLSRFSDFIDSGTLRGYRLNFNIGGWDGLLINTQYPQNNYIGFNQIVINELGRKIEGTAATKVNKVKDTLQQGMGFLSPEICESNPQWRDREEIIAKGFNPPPFVDLGDQKEGETDEEYQAKWEKHSTDYDKDFTKRKADYEKKISCPEGPVKTTPGGVVGQQIQAAIGRKTKIGELDAAIGNSFAAITDALLNHFMDKGLTGLQKAVAKDKKEEFDLRYYDEKVESVSLESVDSEGGSFLTIKVKIFNLKRNINDEIIKEGSEPIFEEVQENNIIGGEKLKILVDKQIARNNSQYRMKSGLHQVEVKDIPGYKKTFHDDCKNPKNPGFVSQDFVSEKGTIGRAIKSDQKTEYTCTIKLKEIANFDFNTPRLKVVVLSKESDSNTPKEIQYTNLMKIFVDKNEIDKTKEKGNYGFVEYDLGKRIVSYKMLPPFDSANFQATFSGDCDEKGVVTMEEKKLKVCEVNLEIPDSIPRLTIKHKGREKIKISIKNTETEKETDVSLDGAIEGNYMFIPGNYLISIKSVTTSLQGGKQEEVISRYVPVFSNECGEGRIALAFLDKKTCVIENAADTDNQGFLVLAAIVDNKGGDLTSNEVQWFIDDKKIIGSEVKPYDFGYHTIKYDVPRGYWASIDGDCKPKEDIGTTEVEKEVEKIVLTEETSEEAPIFEKKKFVYQNINLVDRSLNVELKAEDNVKKCILTLTELPVGSVFIDLIIINDNKRNQTKLRTGEIKIWATKGTIDTGRQQAKDIAAPLEDGQKVLVPHNKKFELPVDKIGYTIRHRGPKKDDHGETIGANYSIGVEYNKEIYKDYQIDFIGECQDEGDSGIINLGNNDSKNCTILIQGGKGNPEAINVAGGIDTLEEDIEIDDDTKDKDETASEEDEDSVDDQLADLGGPSRQTGSETDGGTEIFTSDQEANNMLVQTDIVINDDKATNTQIDEITNKQDVLADRQENAVNQIEAFISSNGVSGGGIFPGFGVVGVIIGGTPEQQVIKANKDDLIRNKKILVSNKNYLQKNKNLLEQDKKPILTNEKLLAKNKNLIKSNNKIIKTEKFPIETNKSLMLATQKLMRANQKTIKSNQKLMQSNKKKGKSNVKTASINKKLLDTNKKLLDINKKLLSKK